MTTPDPQPDAPPRRTAVVLVDHGSRIPRANAMLDEVAAMFARTSRFEIVEPAHMELAEPSIATAFARCVARGAELVVVMPYFLLPGRHWERDIPALTAAAARAHPGVAYLVTAPLGLHPLMAEVVGARVEHCLAHAGGKGAGCEACEGRQRCAVREGGED